MCLFCFIPKQLVDLSLLDFETSNRFCLNSTTSLFICFWIQAPEAKWFIFHELCHGTDDSEERAIASWFNHKTLKGETAKLVAKQETIIRKQALQQAKLQVMRGTAELKSKAELLSMDRFEALHNQTSPLRLKRQTESEKGKLGTSTSSSPSSSVRQVRQRVSSPERSLTLWSSPPWVRACSSMTL